MRTQHALGYGKQSPDAVFRFFFFLARQAVFRLSPSQLQSWSFFSGAVNHGNFHHRTRGNFERLMQAPVHFRNYLPPGTKVRFAAQKCLSDGKMRVA
ncbi:MAG: hypothetical protein ACRECW_03660 [Phyllobacterium sp.]